MDEQEAGFGFEHELGGPGLAFEQRDGADLRVKTGLGDADEVAAGGEAGDGGGGDAVGLAVAGDGGAVGLALDGDAAGAGGAVGRAGGGGPGEEQRKEEAGEQGGKGMFHGGLLSEAGVRRRAVCAEWPCGGHRCGRGSFRE